MMSFIDVQTARDFVTLLLAYFFSMIFVGFAQAFFAKKMGDDTAERHGFLSLDPNVYIDWVGLVCLLVFQFGWGRTVPISRYNFHGRYGSFWFSCVYLFNVFAHIFLAIVAAILAVTVVKSSLVAVVTGHAVPLIDESSTALALRMVFVCILQLNILLAMIRIIFNVVDLIFVFFFDRPAEFIEYRDPYALITMILACIFFGNYIVIALRALVYVVSAFFLHYVLHIC